MKIYLFGDSHSRSFTTFKEKPIDLEKRCTIKNFYKDSSTIRGLNNPTSTTKYSTIILNQLKLIKDTSDSIILLKFGQVDLEYSFYYKKIVKKENITLESFIENTLINYKIFIEKIRNIGNFKIIISAINLPNYKDDIYLKKYMEFIFNITQPNQTDYFMSNSKIKLDLDQKKQLDQLSVLKLTLNARRFNKKLLEFCNKNQIKFLDTSMEFIDLNTGILKKQYLGPDNHYLNVSGNKDGIVQEIFTKKLLDLIFI